MAALTGEAQRKVIVHCEIKIKNRTKFYKIFYYFKLVKMCKIVHFIYYIKPSSACFTREIIVRVAA